MAEQQQTRTKPEKWYTLSVEQTLEKLNVAPGQGLSNDEASRRQEQYGKNELPTAEGTSIIEMIIEQFKDVTVILLIIAAVISIFIGEGKDSIVILFIVVLNAIIGVYQERQAENALAALSKMQTPVVRALRGGHIAELKATELVPGDMVLLEAGDSIPADGRLVEANNVKIDESAMTGESVAVDKDERAQEDTDPPPALADRHNMAYMGTSMTYGRAEMVVTETGLKTQLGNIAALLQNVERGRTPLQDRLEKMGYVLAGAALSICALVFIAGVLRGEEINEMFLTSVSLAVAAVPEGLPAVITVSLALGANRMIKRNALIRKLPAVETLGSVTTICSDKTGTLTRNEMTVTKVVLPGHEEVTVTGVGYEPVGQFMGGGKRDTLHVVDDDQLARIIKAAALCTDAYVEKEHEDAPWHVVGDTTEGALIVLAMKQGWSREGLEQDLPRIKEIPFTSERKSMTTFHEPIGDFSTHLFDDAAYVSFTKGAPDQLLGWASEETMRGGHIPLTDERRQKWHEGIDNLAAQGMRVLGVAYRGWDKLPEDPTPETAERDLILLGLL
ncbi:MAG TPA: HAD-IC family P-type ATPase, partial [Aggregatilineales bacterium]|nr:HAD-IC family P-type ATPase [Aggregatilineales bacterium]